ncbi:urea ABC transporter permease subunit UrtB [Vibrio sp. SM6]|uniref:Urea ABC transporter permease subunit UrtB n=1 Tax=Vibrio agarilyticus TaxID=2726741 RepID=A0A7X8TTU7_9VIBR|nr:urea ABC transporter permease subunit UrtB [Vibrio agarilyticus]NLS14704.1 urea ABC transporter permease subunit UrtB [Vibrio agarilyticus]
MKRIVTLFIAMLSVSMAQWAVASVNDAASFDAALMGKNKTVKMAAIEWLVSSQPTEVSERILTAWLDGALYYVRARNSDHYGALVWLQGGKSATQGELMWQQTPLNISSSKMVKKVSVNNRLRRAIRQQLAVLNLTHSEIATRLTAVNDLLGNDKPAVLASLSAQYQQETNEEVKALIALALNVERALNRDISAATRLNAIDALGEQKHTVVLKTLNQILAQEETTAITKAAEQALGHYQQSQRFYSGIETAFFGLSLGSVLVLAGIGLAITFGVMGVINMAHGELIMIGAYTTYVLQLLLPNHIGLALILAIPAAFLVSCAVGVLIERSVIKHLYGRPLETLLATFGISLILQQAVRSIFSPLNRSVSTPDWMAGAWDLHPMLSLTYNRLYIIVFCALVFAALLLVLKKTSLGLQVRAVSQNRAMARAMGVRSERVDAMTFGLGAGVAGVAGVALSQLTNVGPNMGQAYIIDSFMVVVFGGVGNLWGTLVAGLSLGIFNKVLEPWAGAVLAKILVLVFIILFIQKRPRGLFPQRGRAAES